VNVLTTPPCDVGRSGHSSRDSGYVSPASMGSTVRETWQRLRAANTNWTYTNCVLYHLDAIYGSP